MAVCLLLGTPFLDDTAARLTVCGTAPDPGTPTDTDANAMHADQLKCSPDVARSTTAMRVNKEIYTRKDYMYASFVQTSLLDARNNETRFSTALMHQFPQLHMLRAFLFPNHPEYYEIRWFVFYRFSFICSGTLACLVCFLSCILAPLHHLEQVLPNVFTVSC